MTLEVETVVAVSLMMAVFSAVAAVGSSIVLGVGFERLRSGFEIVRKQTGFFSDAIHKLEEKFEVVDKQTGNFSHSIEKLEAKVENVGEQANAFTQTVQKLEKKVEVVDGQTAFFSDAIQNLSQKIEDTARHEQIVSEKLKSHADLDLISVGKSEALVSRAENLLDEMNSLAMRLNAREARQDAHAGGKEMRLSVSGNAFRFAQAESGEDREEIRYH